MVSLAQASILAPYVDIYDRSFELLDRCKCCQRGGSFSNLEGSSDFFGNHNTPQIVHSSDNPCCGARHLPASTALLGICRPLPLAQVAPPATGGAPIAPQLLSYIFLLFTFVGGDALDAPQRPPCVKGAGRNL